MRIYNRYSAVSYARKYGTAPNKYFYYFWNTGDCTNFVSQAMWAGGWPMLLGVGGWTSWSAKMHEDAINDSNTWISRYASPAWAGAEEFKDFLKLSGRGSISDRFSMQIGDVAQIVNIDGSVEGQGAHHTMLITKTAPPSSSGGIGGANLWFTYHTKNRVDVALAELESLIERDKQLIFWKISDIIYSPAGLIPCGADYDGA